MDQSLLTYESQLLLMWQYSPRIITLNQCIVQQRVVGDYNTIHPIKDCIIFHRGVLVLALAHSCKQKSTKRINVQT
jgi:hypothetical protein